MIHTIEGRQVTHNDIGSIVLYLPNHTNGNILHKDCEKGIITSFSEQTLWVRFRSPNGESCDPNNLKWVDETKDCEHYYIPTNSKWRSITQRCCQFCGDTID